MEIIFLVFPILFLFFVVLLDALFYSFINPSAIFECFLNWDVLWILWAVSNLLFDIRRN